MANPITQIIIAAVDKTKAAFNSVKGGLSSLGGLASSVSGSIGAIFTGLSVAAFIGQIKKTVDAMEEAHTAAQQVGADTESFTAIEYAALQSNVPVEVLQKSLLKLSKIVADARAGDANSKELLAGIGIDPKQVKDSVDGLIQISERFSAMPDGINKTALAIELFGEKVGPRLIPFLNEGRAGIGALMKEARALGVVVTDEAGAAADEFNDNIDKLISTFNGMKIAIANDALPGLNELARVMAEAAKDGGATAAIWAGLKTQFTDFLDNDQLSAVYRLAEAQKQLNALRKDGFDEDHRRVVELKKAIPELERLAAQEKQIAEQRKKDSGAASEDIIADRKAEAKAFRESVDEQVKDANRLQDALTAAYESQLDEQKRYQEEAKKLRAKATDDTAGKDQATIAADASLAGLKLERIKSSATPEEIRAQAEAVRDLANALDDQQKKSFLLQRANLAEADAADKQAAAAGNQATALAEQLRANESRTAEIAKAKDELSRPATLEITSGPGVAQAKADLHEILDLLTRIGDKPLAVGTVINGAPADMAAQLRIAALKYGRRP